MKKLPAALKTINQVKKDCLNIKRKRDLTDYGEGQLILSQIILKEMGSD